MTEIVPWDDPCQRATALRNAYYALLSGAQAIEIRTRTVEAEELVKFQPGNLDALRIELSAAESQCLASMALTAGTNTLPRRFAITGRFKRRFDDRYPGHPFGCGGPFGR